MSSVHVGSPGHYEHEENSCHLCMLEVHGIMNMKRIHVICDCWKSRAL